MRLLTRREFVSAGAALLGFCAHPALALEPQEEVRIGYLPITDAAPLLIAHALGYFADEGLPVAKPVKMRSWSLLTEAFLAEKCNITHLLLPIPIWMRFNKGIAVKMLAWDHTNGSAITVRGDGSINRLTDLGGRQLAVPYWYSMHNVILQMALRAVDLEPVVKPQSARLTERQVNLFILPPSEMPPALAAGKIDGYIVAEPFNALSEERMGAKILRFTGDIWQNHPCCVVVAKEEMVSRRPVFTQKVINAVVRAQHWLRQNRQAAARILSRDGRGKYLPVSQEILHRVFSGYEVARYGPGALPQAIHHPHWPVERIGFQPYPFPSATEFIMAQMRQTLLPGDRRFLDGLAVKNAARELADDRFVKGAIDQVGGPAAFGIGTDNPWQRKEQVVL